MPVNNKKRPVSSGNNATANALTSLTSPAPISPSVDIKNPPKKIIVGNINDGPSGRKKPNSKDSKQSNNDAQLVIFRQRISV